VVIEETPITTTRMERIVQTVSVPQKVMKTVPVTEIRLVPRTVTRRIPIDSNGNPILIESLGNPAITDPTKTTSNPAVSSPSDLPASNAPLSASPATEGTSVTSKKPAITESGDLPAPSAPTAPPVPTQQAPAAESSSTTEVTIGQTPAADPKAIEPDASAGASNEKSGKIRVTGDE
jgi:hypothetical protein